MKHLRNTCESKPTDSSHQMRRLREQAATAAYTKNDDDEDGEDDDDGDGRSVVWRVEMISREGAIHLRADLIEIE